MFADYVKMGVKAAILVTGALIVINFLNNFWVSVPQMDYVTSFINKAYTIGHHYIPYWDVLYNTGVMVLNLNLVFYSARLALIAIRWVLKVNE